MKPSHSYEDREGDIITSDFYLQNFLSFTFTHNLTVPQSLIEGGKNKYPYFDWLLDPGSFDYQKFDPRWVLNYPAKSFPNRFHEEEETLENVKKYLSTNSNPAMAEWYMKAYS